MAYKSYAVAAIVLLIIAAVVVGVIVWKKKEHFGSGAMVKPESAYFNDAVYGVKGTLPGPNNAYPADEKLYKYYDIGDPTGYPGGYPEYVSDGTHQNQAVRCNDLFNMCLMEVPDNGEVGRGGSEHRVMCKDLYKNCMSS